MKSPSGRPSSMGRRKLSMNAASVLAKSASKSDDGVPILPNFVPTRRPSSAPSGALGTLSSQRRISSGMVLNLPRISMTESVSEGQEATRQALVNAEVTTEAEAKAWYMYDLSNQPVFFIVIGVFLPMFITGQAKDMASKNGGWIKFEQKGPQEMHPDYVLSSCSGEAHLEGNVTRFVDGARVDYQGNIQYASLEAANETAEYDSSSCTPPRCEEFGPKDIKAYILSGFNDYDPNAPSRNVTYEGGLGWGCEWEPAKGDVPGYWGHYKAVTNDVTSASVVLQLLVFLGTGAAGDYGGNRKRFMMGFHFTGVVLFMLVLRFTESKYWWCNALICLFSNVVFGAAIIFYNAYLPMLVLTHYEVVELAERVPPPSEEEVKDKLFELTNRLSANGTMIAYSGGFMALVVSIGILMWKGTSAEGVAMVCFVIAIWALIFGSISFAFLRTRPGPPLPPGTSLMKMGVSRSYVTLKITYEEMKHTFRFLIANSMYSDGNSTINSIAPVFAFTELGMGVDMMLIALAVIFISAPAGGLVFLKAQNAFGLSQKTLLIIILVLFCGIPLYAYFGLKTQFEFFILAAVYGFLTGPLGFLSRSLFSELVPAGHESEYFSIYEITDKGTALLGPLVVARTLDATDGDYRIAFLTVMAFFVAGIVGLLTFDRDTAIATKSTFEALHKAGEVTGPREGSLIYARKGSAKGFKTRKNSSVTKITPISDSANK